MLTPTDTAYTAARSRLKGLSILDSMTRPPKETASTNSGLIYCCISPSISMAICSVPNSSDATATPTYTASTHRMRVTAPGMDRDSTYGINFPLTRSPLGCSARTTEGSAVTSVSKSSMLLVVKKYCECRIKQNAASSTVKSVFMM